MTTTTVDTTREAETTARTFAANLESAWNSADGTAFAAQFTDDAVFVDIRGFRHRGRHAIGAGHQGIFDSIYRGSSVTYEVESADRAAADVAVVHANATLDAPSGPLAGVNHSRFTAILVRHDGAWLASTFHNTLVNS